MDPMLIGYFPRHTLRRPVAPSLRNVEEVCSLGQYGQYGPENWVDQWQHNTMWLYDSEEIALKVMANAIDIHIEPDPGRNPPWQVRLTREPRTEFDYYAYKLFPLRFTNGKEERLNLPSMKVLPLPSDYRRLGYDAVNGVQCSDPGNATYWAEFGCSPLFCNGMANQIPVNRYCLIDEPERAFEVARSFSVGDVEPGPYFVVEVWRKDQVRPLT